MEGANNACWNLILLGDSWLDLVLRFHFLFNSPRNRIVSPTNTSVSFLSNIRPNLDEQEPENLDHDQGSLVLLGVL